MDQSVKEESGPQGLKHFKMLPNEYDRNIKIQELIEITINLKQSMILGKTYVYKQYNHSSIHGEKWPKVSV